jgi:uncharacterized protein YbjT (DUF2867 family)
MANNKKVIVTGASSLLEHGYKVVATSRTVSKAGFEPSPNLALVDGDIGQASTADDMSQVCRLPLLDVRVASA